MARPIRTGADTTDITWRDLIMLALAGFIACIVIMLPWIAPKKTADGQQGIKPTGAVMVEVRWPDENPADVDLWVQAPGDIPVGYSNNGGAYFNLLRDDLGRLFDATNLNYESSFARGLPAGEYVVNLHLYRGMTVPIACKVVVSVQSARDPIMRQILATEVTLQREGQERTALRFKLDGEGKLVSGSVHTAQKALRSGGKP